MYYPVFNRPDLRGFGITSDGYFVNSEGIFAPISGYSKVCLTDNYPFKVLNILCNDWNKTISEEFKVFSSSFNTFSVLSLFSDSKSTQCKFI